MQAVELSEFLDLNYRAILLLLKSGAIKATKNNGKWNVSENEAQQFKENNSKAIETLKTEITSLYWQGTSVGSLQKRAKEELVSRKIIAKKSNFAEKTIYESVMKDQIG